jgi:hypothetical protein
MYERAGCCAPSRVLIACAGAAQGRRDTYVGVQGSESLVAATTTSPSRQSAEANQRDGDGHREAARAASWSSHSTTARCGPERSRLVFFRSRSATRGDPGRQPRLVPAHRRQSRTAVTRVQ